MSIDPASIHRERYKRIGEVIDRDREVILSRWRQRCSELQPDAADEHPPALERVREFLQALAVQLISTRPQASEPQETAAELGGLRWQLGWDIRLVVREYMLLRLILLDHLDQTCEPTLSGDELLAISLNFDEAITAAVTAFSEHEQQVRDEYESELERSNRELRRFAHTVAHELKSPLNAQSMGLKLIELHLGDTAEQGELQQVLEITRDSVVQMTNLINELLRYAEVGDDESELQSTNCREVLDLTVRYLQTQIAASGADVQYGDLPTIMANPATLGLLFQNLIGNAIHYRSDASPRIRIEACSREGQWQFSVSDNGLGIQAEDLSRIFEMFARAHAERRPGGTGIGLAMCRRIVQQYGGRIWVKSEPGVGSRFFFTIPAATEPSATEGRQRNPVSVA